MNNDKLIAKINFIKNDRSRDELLTMPWNKAESLVMNKFWNGERAPDSRHSVARLLWSDTALYVRFDCRQSEPLFLNENPQTAEKTMLLWEHDVCEVFLATDLNEPRRYAEFEISPKSEWLDLLVDWTRDEPRDWDHRSGMEAFSSIEPDRVVMMMKVPWSAFDGIPAAGDVWLGNLYRQVGFGETRGYLTWSPTLTPDPQFHVPEKFGEFVFVK